MKKCAAWVLAVLLAFVTQSRAEISNPDLVRLADSYRNSLAVVQEQPEEVLRRLNEARKAGDAAQIVRWSEALVALGDHNPQTWLTLSKAWMQVDPAASNGLAAAVEAVNVAQGPQAQADRLEALLLVSSFLRARLQTDRARYDDALGAVRAAKAALAQLDQLTGNEDLLAPDPHNPDGRVEALRRTIASADRDSSAAAADISSTALALDEIYRELQAAIPSLAVSDMQQADKRLEFHVQTDAQGLVAPKYEFRGSDVRACLSFSKTLKQDSLAYEALVGLKQQDQPVDRKDYDVVADADNLCVLRLEPGKNYALTLSADFPAEDGAVLTAALDVQIFVPNLPASIGFGDGEFILPRSGPGELPISLTNIEDIPLSIHRVVDRSLYRHLALGQIRNGIPNAEYQDLLERFSEVLWRGAAKRRFEDKEWNTIVRTLVPVGSILKDRTDWLNGVDARDSSRSGELSSGLQPVQDISDPRLSIEGRFLAGSLDANPETAKAFVPGVYALVAPVPVPDSEACNGRPYSDCEVYAAQWFLRSDLGLTFYEGEREFSVMVRSLETGDPVVRANVQLIAQGNRLLAEQASNEDGIAVFSRAITRGDGSNKLIAVMVETADDFNFLQYGSERLDLSRLNVGSAVEDNKERALLYTERGIYQPGETIQAFGLLRERHQIDPLLQSAELRLEISDYTVAKRQLLPGDWSAGGSLVPLTIPPTARSGAAVLKLVANTDEVIAESRLQIGKVRPDRARLEFRQEAGAQLKATRTGRNTANVSAEIRAQYLYGAQGTGQAPAANLKAEITVRVAPAVTPPGRCYDGFVFGAFDDASLPAISRNRVEFTDADGMLHLNLDQVRLPSTSRPLVATIEVTLFDASGPVAAGQSEVAIPPELTALGLSVRPRLSPEGAAGYQMALNVASLDATGLPAVGRDLAVLLERENESYAWQQIDDVWQHITLRHRDKVSQETMRLDGQLIGTHEGCAGYFALEKVATGLPAGRYVVTVTDPQSGALASARFVTGVAQTSVKDLEPNLFVLSSDKARYAPGEQVSLSVDAPFRTGKVAVAVATGDIKHWYPGEVVDGHATVSFAADKAWAGMGLHALATVFKQDAANTRQLGPSRAIGAAYFEVSNEADFKVSVVTQALSEHESISPGEPLTFDVCVKRDDGTCNVDFKEEETYAVAFVVDEGLLSLTNHASAFMAIEEEFFGRHKLGLRIMDNYGRLLLHEGGDRPGRMALTNYTSPRIVAASQGPRKLENGRATFTFADPGLQSGSLKVFVVAWSPAQVSTAEQTLAVRNLFISSLGLPEFFLAGDRPELPLRLENIGFTDHRGDYALTLSAAGGITARLTLADGTALDKDATGAFLMPVPMGAPKDLRVALEIPAKLQGTFDLSLGVNAVGAATDLPPQERVRKWTLDVRPATVMVSEYLPPIPLQAKPANLARVLDGVIKGRYDPDTVKVTARFANEEDTLRLAASDPVADPAKSILEDSVWRGMIDLRDRALVNDAVVKGRVQAYADSVQALQLVDGSFAPYRTNGNFIPAENGADGTRYGLLDSVSALDFLIRARGAGYAISADAVRNALAFIEASVDSVFEIDSEGYATARDPKAACSFDTRYAMLVLAQQDRLKSAYVGAVEDCDNSGDGDDNTDGAEAKAPAAAEPEVFSELVTLAVLSQYGDVVDPEQTLAAHYEKPADYLGDLDDYRKAIAVSMLANAKADGGMVKRAAETLLSNGHPLDLRTRAWLARTVADLDSPASARLKSSDLDLSDADVMPLSERPDGIVESQEIAYGLLEDAELEISKPKGPKASAYLRIIGARTDSTDMALPESSLRRRLYCAVNGKEIDLATQKLEVGDDVVLVVEATRDALSRFDAEAYGGLGATYGPLMVHTPLPSAFALVATDLTGIKPKGALAQLAMAGRMRSIDSDAQSWNAIIVPVSSTAKFEADKKLHRSGDEGDGNEGGGEGEDGGASQPAVAPQDDSSTIDAAEDGIEFRQAFVVTVGSTGSYSFPPTTIEPLDFPGDTLVSSAGQFEVGGPSPCRAR